MRTIKTTNQSNRIRLRHLKRRLKNQYEIKSYYDDQELRAMQRSPVREKPGSNLFCVLTQQLLWQNFDQTIN